MNINLPVLSFNKLKGYADYKLLLFLLLFLNVKLAVKIPAILLIYLFQFNFKLGFSFKNSRLPLFYPLIIIIAFIDLLINKSYEVPNYIPVLLTGVIFWIISILAVHQVKLAVERNDTSKIHRTLLFFFIINAITSFINLTYIIWHTGAINPYLYQGEYQKYFLSTGDYIKGITFDNSTTNAILNAFAVIYFLIRKNNIMMLVCMIVLLLAGSNFTNVILFGILTLIFIFNSTRDQKSLIIICITFLVIFMTRISPQNNDYFVNTIKSTLTGKLYKSPWPTSPIPVTQRPDSTLSPDEKKQKLAILYIDSVRNETAAKKRTHIKTRTLPETSAGRIILPKVNLDLPVYQYLRSTPPEKMQLTEFIENHKPDLKLSGKSFYFTGIPGKVTGLLQTINLFKNNPAKILTGNGVGNFSSKLAFRATGLKLTGGYPTKYVYINHDFLVNHLDIYLEFFSKDPSFHSLTNSPFSVYDQILAEYGLLGLLFLFIFYIYFFGKHYYKLTYGIPLLAFVIAIFFIDYWFEQLSVMVMFELMLFLNIKENKELQPNLIKT